MIVLFRLNPLSRLLGRASLPSRRTPSNSPWPSPVRHASGPPPDVGGPQAWRTPRPFADNRGGGTSQKAETIATTMTAAIIRLSPKESVQLTSRRSIRATIEIGSSGGLKRIAVPHTSFQSCSPMHPFRVHSSSRARLSARAYKSSVALSHVVLTSPTKLDAPPKASQLRGPGPCPLPSPCEG